MPDVAIVRLDVIADDRLAAVRMGIVERCASNAPAHGAAKIATTHPPRTSTLRSSERGENVKVSTAGVGILDTGTTRRARTSQPLRWNLS